MLSLRALQRLLILAAALGAAALLSLQPQVDAGVTTVFTVDSTGDESDDDLNDDNCDTGAGACTLRAAIEQANALGVAKIPVTHIEIEFDIMGEPPHVISPQSPLPAVTNIVSIAGSAPVVELGGPQPPQIVLDGTNAGEDADGIVLEAGLSSLSNLAIMNFDGNGVVLRELGGNFVGYNWIGIDTEGGAAGNGANGIVVDGVQDNAMWFNFVSGNSDDGIQISSDGADANIVNGNVIGLGPDIETPVPNGGNGITIDNGAGNNVGGTSVPLGATGPQGLANTPNVIAGNTVHGILIEGPDAASNIVIGNYIGINQDSVPEGNGGYGIAIIDAQQTMVGGSIAAERNVISANGAGGVLIQGLEAEENWVRGNYIGTDTNGAADLGNDGHGVDIQDAPANLIGGDDMPEGNLISGNEGHGVSITQVEAIGNEVRGNVIGLAADGATALPNGQSGVYVASGGNFIGSADRGNVISGNTGHGLVFEDAASGSVYRNRIGTDMSGEVAIGNGGDGVFLLNSSGIQVGGPGDERNLISGNDGAGVHIEGGAGNSVANNRIGTDLDGTTALPNALGVEIEAGDNHTIGGDDASWRNLISGNTGPGVSVSDESIGTKIFRNYIGTNAAGDAALPNQHGVRIEDSEGAEIGDGTVSTRNVISGNTEHGIAIIGEFATNTAIRGNFIGLNATGDAALGNGLDGIFLNGGTTTSVGHEDDLAVNVISGNGRHGLNLIGPSTGTVVLRSFIGTDATGQFAIGNEASGVRVSGSTSNTIGMAGQGNLISGNLQPGITLEGGADDNTVLANLIGTNSNGTSAIPNLNDGIWVNQSDGAVIGQPGAGNLIAGNSCAGVALDESNFSIVQSNVIGRELGGDGPLPNGCEGVYIQGSSNTVGGLEEGEENVIAHSGIQGVYVQEGEGNAILSNSIYANGLLGIDLAPPNVNPNGTETDANGGQNYPVLTLAASEGGMFRVDGTLSSGPVTQYTLQFFANDVCDPLGFGEGETLITTQQVQTDDAGNVEFSFQVAAGVSAGQQVTATATEEGVLNTSEFSECIEVAGEIVEADLEIEKTATPDPATAGEPLTYEITVTNNGPDDATNVTVTDTLPEGVTDIGAGSSQGSPCDVVGAVVTCNLGSIASGESATVDILVIPSEEGELSNTASVEGDQLDPDEENNEITIETVVEAAPEPIVVQLFEGWVLVPDWPGGTLASVAAIIAFMDASVDPNVWLALAHYTGTEWQQTFEDAPLPAFNTLTLISTGADIWVYSSADATLTFEP